MKEYETIYILTPGLTSASSDAIKAKLDGMIKKDSGHVLVHSEWGKKKLAYSINKQKNGQFIYLKYVAPGVAVSNIERNLKYDESVLRFITVKLDDRVDVEARIKADHFIPPFPVDQVEEHGHGGGYRDRGDRDHGGGYGDRPRHNDYNN